MTGWFTNNPEAAEELRKIDAAYAQERANAAHLPLKQKIVSHRCAKQRRDQAYDEVAARLATVAIPGRFRPVCRLTTEAEADETVAIPAERRNQ